LALSLQLAKPRRLRPCSVKASQRLRSPSHRPCPHKERPRRSTNSQQVPGAARITTGLSALSLEQAIKLAIDNNLATLLATEATQRSARICKGSARRELLPNISGAAYQASITENLAALGFTPGRFPGFTSTFIGPFKNFDARFVLSRRFSALSALRTYQAGRAGVRVAEMEENLAREQVATFTSLAYLESMR